VGQQLPQNFLPVQPHETVPGPVEIVDNSQEEAYAFVPAKLKKQAVPKHVSCPRWFSDLVS
jgi:hypothetical protein